jgi:hypothetical protein
MKAYAWSLGAWNLGLAAILICGPSFAQQAEGERPPRPESASNAAIGGWCDALTGAKKEECLRDERRRQEERKAQGAATRGSCDALVGPDKERCLRQGGTIEVDAKAGAGATLRSNKAREQ